MSLNLALALISGNLVREPEGKDLPSGAQVVDFGVAVNKNYKDKDGNKVEKAAFLNCVAFGKTGEFVEEYFHKGDPIFVEAEIDQDNWEDKESGAKRSAIKFKVKEVRFAGSKKESGETGASPAPTKQKKGKVDNTVPAAAEGDESIPF